MGQNLSEAHAQPCSLGNEDYRPGLLVLGAGMSGVQQRDSNGANGLAAGIDFVLKFLDPQASVGSDVHESEVGSAARTSMLGFAPPPSVFMPLGNGDAGLVPHTHADGGATSLHSR